jgi:hypothetical protein
MTPQEMRELADQSIDGEPLLEPDDDGRVEAEAVWTLVWMMETTASITEEAGTVTEDTALGIRTCCAILRHELGGDPP